MSDAKRNLMVPGYVNPLAFTEVEEPWVSQGKDSVTEEQLRRYLCEPGIDHGLDAILKRFKEISIEGDDRLFTVPEGILNKIIWPLRHSKASYSLGNYLGAIALCGMVAEMATLLWFEAIAEHLGVRSGRAKPVAKFKSHFEPGAFERLGQAERIKVLYGMDLIPEEVKEWLHEVRLIRKRHLHLMSHGTEGAAKDAVRAFLASVKVVKFVLGLGIAKDGKLTLNPQIIAWMESQGHKPVELFFGVEGAADFARRLSGSVDPA